jgi:cytochrome c553
MTVLRTLLLIACSTLSTAILAQADVAAGKAKSAVCAACHGADGNSTNPIWPNLAGQHPGYIVKQLEDFKSDKKTRSNALMLGMAAALNDADRANLAAFYSSQSASSGFASKSADLELGKKIYRGGNAVTGVPACMSCHGPSGAGDPKAGFPVLSGQHAQYTQLQLESFRLETRSNDKQAMMRDIALKLTPKEIAAVSAYINGLH